MRSRSPPVSACDPDRWFSARASSRASASGASSSNLPCWSVRVVNAISTEPRRISPSASRTPSATLCSTTAPATGAPTASTTEPRTLRSRATTTTNSSASSGEARCVEYSVVQPAPPAVTKPTLTSPPITKRPRASLVTGRSPRETGWRSQPSRITRPATGRCSRSTTIPWRSTSGTATGAADGTVSCATATRVASSSPGRDGAVRASGSASAIAGDGSMPFATGATSPSREDSHSPDPQTTTIRAASLSLAFMARVVRVVVTGGLASAGSPTIGADGARGSERERRECGEPTLAIAVVLAVEALAQSIEPARDPRLHGGDGHAVACRDLPRCEPLVVPAHTAERLGSGSSRTAASRRACADAASSSGSEPGVRSGRATTRSRSRGWRSRVRRRARSCASPLRASAAEGSPRRADCAARRATRAGPGPPRRRSRARGSAPTPWPIRPGRAARRDLAGSCPSLPVHPTERNRIDVTVFEKSPGGARGAALRSRPGIRPPGGPSSPTASPATARHLELLRRAAMLGLTSHARAEKEPPTPMRSEVVARW
jgi:hypothetical protein